MIYQSLTGAREFPFSSPVRGRPETSFRRRNAQFLGSRARYLTDWYIKGLVQRYRSQARWRRWSSWSGLMQRHGNGSEVEKSWTSSLCFSSRWTLEPINRIIDSKIALKTHDKYDVAMSLYNYFRICLKPNRINVLNVDVIVKYFHIIQFW